MAKFKKNHIKSSNSSTFLLRGAVITVFLSALIIYGFIQFFEKKSNDTNDSKQNSYSNKSNNEYNGAFDNDIETIIPDDNSDVVHHKYYSLGYNESKEQANWVAYQLTKASLKVPNVKRAKNFKPDYAVETRSAFHRDYTNSGYTRGHLAPAGDMAFSKDAMQECFYMSNMSPQIRPFNNGIWKELEELTRDWAYKKDVLLIVTGPLFYDKSPIKIGQNKVVVPDAFYKIIIDKEKGRDQAISFVIPHEKSNIRLADYAVSIDDVEELSGIDFFPSYFNSKSEENKIESSINIDSWKFNEKKYQQRINSWNKQ